MSARLTARSKSVLRRGADIIKAELEEKQFKVKLNVIDTPGFGDYVNNRESWAPIIDFIVSLCVIGRESRGSDSYFGNRTTSMNRS